MGSDVEPSFHPSIQSQQYHYHQDTSSTSLYRTRSHSPITSRSVVSLFLLLFHSDILLCSSMCPASPTSVQ